MTWLRPSPDAWDRFSNTRFYFLLSPWALPIKALENVNSRTHTECACLCNCLRFKFCLSVLMSSAQSVTVTQTAGRHTSNRTSRNRRDEFSLYSTSSHQKTTPGLLSVCGLIHTTRVQFTQKPLIGTNLLKLNESFIKLQQTSTGGFWSAYSWKPKSIVLKLSSIKP